MTKKSKLHFDKQSLWLAAALVHFVASFFYTGKIFTNSHLPGNTNLVPMTGGVSSGLEHILAVCGTRLIGAVLILFFWFCVNRLFTGKYSKGIITLFFMLFAVFGCYTLLMYPDMFAIEKDTYIIFSHAIREIPYYWHQVLTGYFLGGCLVLFPHPIIIPLLQTAGFLGVVCYGVAGVNRLQKRKGYWLLLLLLLPEAMYLMIEPYRNCFYTILLLWACMYVLIGVLEKRQQSWKSLLWQIPFFAVLAVWRTEGIFPSVVMMFLVIACLTKMEWKRMIAAVVIFFICIFGLNQIHGFGTAKYYGKDYFFVTTMNSARAIIRNGSNLQYAGAELDIEVINLVCPDVAVEGVLGFRKANEAAGRNINQSGITGDLQSKYTKAYVNLVIHNPKVFLWNQLNYALTALQTEGFFPLIYNYGQSPEHYDSWEAEYKADMQELESTAFTMQWKDNSFRKSAIQKLSYYRSILRKYIEVTRIPVALHFVVYIYLFVLLLESFFAIVFKRENRWVMFLAIAGLFAQFGAIVMTMPEARESYFYAVNMCMTFTAFLYWIQRRETVLRRDK